MFRALTFLVVFAFFNLGCWSLIQYLRRPLSALPGGEFSRTALRLQRRYILLALATLTALSFWGLMDTFFDLLRQPPF